MIDGWILGFDTATRATAVALTDAGGSVLEARDDPPRGTRPRHAQRLLPLCAEVLGRAGIGFQDLDRLAVGRGPGTFTGLRIGVATARALARASGVSLVGVPTLQALALNALADAAVGAYEVVAPVLDARRGEVFAAAWKSDALDGLSDPVLEARALTPEAMSQRLAAFELPVLALGEGSVEFRTVLERAGAFVPDDGAAVHRVSAVGHCRIARQLTEADPGQISPDYLRLPDAEIARRVADNQ